MEALLPVREAELRGRGFPSRAWEPDSCGPARAMNDSSIQLVEAKPLPADGIRRLDWLLLVVCALVDFLLAPLFTSLNGSPPSLRNAWLFAALGCTLAQGNTLAAWLVWSDGPFLRRLTVHWGIAGALCAIWLAGLRMFVKPEDAIFASSTIVLAVPLVSMAAQMPLWIVRYFFGWRLVRGDGQNPIAAEPPLTIRDLLVATLLVAGAFACARLLPQIQQEQRFWLVWCVACGVTAVISTFSMLPAGALLMRPRLLNRALLYGCVYAGLFISLVWIVAGILWVEAPQYLVPSVAYVWLSSLMLGFAGTLTLAAVAARAHGYRLVWGRRRR
jgi:hypothetical protein